MKNKAIMSLAVAALCLTSCYESYEKDFEVTRAYFASQKPLRTLVADTGMYIKVGVAIGGKREVDTKDWATFEIDPALLDGTGLTLMPESYYRLADPSRMTISNPDLAICDVRLDFNDDFYNDDLAAGTHYAIPFRMTGHSQDEVLADVNGNLMDYSIVAVKFVSRWHGTYYVRGKMTDLSTGEVSEYYNKDLSRNITRDLATVSRNVVRRTGFGSVNVAGEALDLIVNEDLTVTLKAAGSVAVEEASASLNPEADGLELAGKQPEFTISYVFVRSGVKYRVEETLTRRQNPEADLRFEEW
ncbi:MAG: BT_3987 domain-containing protein [Candidatus Cryptobacteroides sp.]